MAFKLERRKTAESRFATSSLHLGGSPYQLAPQSRTSLRVGIIVTIAFHALLFLVTFPSAKPPVYEAAQTQRTFMVTTVRFKPPPPAKAKPIPQRKTRKIPIPDPTPEDPEPLIEEEMFEAPEIDFDGLSDVLFEIPAAPSPAAPPGTMWVEGDVVAPTLTYNIRPHYTEEARRARIQGSVILQYVVDTVGNVGYVKVLKGLPEGLTESAVQTVEQWRYEPATLYGEPVPVRIHMTINFSVQ